MAAQLEGSAKQIAWAAQIRANFETHSTALATKVQDGMITWVSAKVRARFVTLISEITSKYLANTTSAKAWIDNKHLGTAGGVESFFVARLKKDAEAQALMTHTR